MKTPAISQAEFPVLNYNLDATLNSGQAFRWEQKAGWWEGVIGRRWVRLRATGRTLHAETSGRCSNWNWLENYLQTGVPLDQITATFPRDPAMSAALRACEGLRLLRQDPWECLASFILSSSKQIVQIKQIIHTLCVRFGEPISLPPGHSPKYGFPAPAVIAQAAESDLRECKMGFRAPYLLKAARMVATRAVDLAGLSRMGPADSRQELLRLPGVGRKIADCVLLFAYGFPEAFPIDVWIMKALRDLYFNRRKVKIQRLQKFTASYFGPFPGYAQQYLFHYMRVARKDSFAQLESPGRTRRISLW